MWLDFFFAISLILPGLWVIRLTRIRTRSLIELVCFSYILSLAIMFGLLYIGGITNTFEVTSLAYLAIVIVSLVHLSLEVLAQVLRGPHSFRNSLRHILSGISSEQIILIVTSIALLCVYMIFLSSKAILDSDVAHEYLPIAREIIRQNGFTYSTGYDYSVFLKPIGGSVLYAWTYAIRGSIFSESFRLMPLIPISLLIFLNYAIATAATGSKTIGMTSTALFLIFPFNDRFLLYTSFYPDVFYYPLIFAAIYLTIENFRGKRSRDLFWAGLALGTASLLKAQTIYFLIAFILVFVILQLRNSRKLAAILCVFTPFYVLIPSILADSIRSEGFHLSIPNLTETQLGLLLFLSALSGLSYLSVGRYFSKMSIERSKIAIARLAKGIFLFLVPLAAVSSLWYLNNQIRFGTLISTSSMNLPNYNWALETLRLGAIPAQVADFSHYFAYFVFMFVDPAVMGYVMLVPLLIGLIFVFKGHYKNFRVLFFFGIISASVLLSSVAVSLPSALGYNPRDILPLAPLLATLSAIGIFHATSDSHLNNTHEAKSTFVPVVFVAYFGLLAYVHSVYVHFTGYTSMTAISGLMSALASSVGLSLTQTSFELPYADRAIFVGQNLFKISSLSLVAGIPILIYWSRNRFMQERVGTHANFRAPIRWALLKGQRARTLFVISLLVAIIVLPRVEMLVSEGGPNGIKESQLRKVDGSLYTLFVDSSELNGDILAFSGPPDLPYYIYGHKIIDLSHPENLAFLKDCFQSVTPRETVVKLTDYGIRYLIVNPPIHDAFLNNVLSRIIQDPELAILFRDFGMWKLYSLGPYSVEKTSLSLSGWNIDPHYTNASFTLDYDGTNLSLALSPTNKDSRATIVNYDLPKLSLSDYDYILAKVEGESNSRTLIRFWLGDGTGFDIAYWNDPQTITYTTFELTPYFGQTFRGEAYIGLMSSDGMPSSIKILEMSFVKVRGYLTP